MRTRILFIVCAILFVLSRRTRGDEAYDAIRAGDHARIAQLLAHGHSPDSRDSQGNTLLMQAALSGNLETMKLLIERGAEVNATNPAGATALMRAAGDTAKIKLLVEHGANVNARSAIGNTPLILAARAQDSTRALELLIERGADVNATNVFGATAIQTAAAAGEEASVRLLLSRGADVNAHSRANENAVLWGGGRSPLMWAAARGDLKLMRLLLEGGANVNEPEGFGTALTQAAWMDRPAAARLLLEKGAQVNATEQFSGFTALHWAAGSENGDPTLTRLLLEHGANPNAEGGEPIDAFMGTPQTPLMLAEKRGETPIVAALRAAGARSRQTPAKPLPPPSPDFDHGFDRAALKRALNASLEGLQKSAVSSKTTFVNHASKQDCVSCHQQYLPMTALAMAKICDGNVDGKAEEALIEMVRRDDANLYEMTAQSTFHPEPVHSYGYTLLAWAAQGQNATPEIDGIVHHLLVIQGEDGQWHVNLPRPPIQTSDIGATALAIHALKHYGFPARQKEINRRIARARSWLARQQPRNTEERTYQLMGLAWAGDKQLQKLSRALEQEQRPDGGWGQLPKLPSDAYATGQALYALHLAGQNAGTPAFQRGLRFLLATQREDGSWFVARRAVPFQPSMPSGYPHGRDGWISATATSWAAMALATAITHGPEQTRLLTAAVPSQQP